MRSLLNKFIPVVFAVLAASCGKDTLVEETVTGGDDEIVSYRISFNADDVKTKVLYEDNINDPVKKDGDDTFKIKWKEGDEVVAIRWPRDLKSAPTHWFTLVAKKDGETAKILFDCSKASFPKDDPLAQGERFVLVHGDFVLGDESDKASLSFPIARYDFPYSPIHYGGTVKDNRLYFDSQDGSLDKLSEHEFMVVDAYVNIVKNSTLDSSADYDEDKIGVVQLTSTPVDAGTDSPAPITLSSVNSIIRLQAFVPDAYFEGDKSGETIQALSISTADHSKLFYRYFRMHPNASERVASGNYWPTDENTASESNPYLRVNLEEGFNPLVDNAGQEKIISKPYTNTAGIKGRLVTAYFAVASTTLDGKPLEVCLFTNSHVYKPKRTYVIPDEALTPGSVIPLSVNFRQDNVTEIPAITDGQLGVTFAPGFVYAEKVDGQWSYGLYEHQGQYAGMSRQSLDFGEYFVFGSVDPTEAFHSEMVNGSKVDKGAKNYYKSTAKQDVAHKVAVKGITPFTMPTKAEADRIYQRIMSEGRYCIGYYYYPVESVDDRTYHLSDNARSRMAAAGVPADDGHVYAGSYGIWIGTKSQPRYDQQDRFVFIPDSKQFSDKVVSQADGFENGSDGGYTLASKGYLYYPGAGWDREEETLKYSANTCDEAPQSGMCYRLQFWYRGSSFISASTNVKAMEVTFARPVRGVIF